jgi:L-ascorbate metabolism protein UlaG (beta-lactamase superfamily)
MKIQFFGGTTFGVFGKSARILFDPTAKNTEKNIDFITFSNGEAIKGIESKKALTLPGEFEISNVLIRGVASRPENTVYKVVIEDLVIAHFGNLAETPVGKFFEILGENVDIALISVSEKFPVKKIKEILEDVDPRMVIFGGDPLFFPQITAELGAQTAEENPFNVSRSQLSEEKTDYFFLPL